MREVVSAQMVCCKCALCDALGYGESHVHRLLMVRTRGTSDGEFKVPSLSVTRRCV